MNCHWCDGRGWGWRGTLHNAHREACEVCQGSGKTSIDYWHLVGLLAMLASAVSVSLLVLLAVE